MCEKCKPLDDRIARCRELLRAIPDQQTAEGIRDLIRKLETEKKAFHPER